MTLIYLSSDKILGSFIAALIAQSLTNNRGNNFINLDNNNNSLAIAFDVLKSLAKDGLIDKNLLVNQGKNLSGSEILIAFFPLIIYTYQNSEKLAIILDNCCGSKVNQDSIKVFIIVVNLILSQQLEFKKITPQIMAYLDDKKQEIISHLQLIDEMIINRQPLTEVDNIFKENFKEDSLAIYQSLYAFFSYPYHLENSLQRSTYFAQQSQATAILTGYLLGLYHGYIHIPYSLRSQLKLNPKIREIEILTEKLVANWQGKMDNE